MSTILDQLLDEVRAERARQDETHGPERDLPHTTSTPTSTGMLLRIWRDIVAKATDRGDLTYEHLLFCELAEALDAGTVSAQVTELVQVAALALKDAEALLRRRDADEVRS